MKTISTHEFCTRYNVPQSFINSLFSFDLIELVEVESNKHIQLNDINRIEKLMRIHFELEVNFEGLDVINNLTNQINALQNEVVDLRNRLAFYE